MAPGAKTEWMALVVGSQLSGSCILTGKSSCSVLKGLLNLIVVMAFQLYQRWVIIVSVLAVDLRLGAAGRPVLFCTRLFMAAHEMSTLEVKLEDALAPQPELASGMRAQTTGTASSLLMLDLSRRRSLAVVLTDPTTWSSSSLRRR